MSNETAVIKIQYDTEEANKSIDKLTNTIDNNRARQVELKEELKKGKISQLNYKKQTEELTQSINRDTFERKKYINVIQSEIGSVKRAKAENQIMREERNKLSTATEEGRKKIEEYNKKIDKNTEYIKANVDGQSRMFMTLGKVQESLGKIQGPIGGIINGFVGMTKAAWAFVANPIGAVITAIVGVLALLRKAFMGTEENQNKLNKGTALLKGIFNALLKALRPIAEFLVNSFGKALEFVGNAVDKTLGGISKALDFLGFDKAAASVSNFKDRIEETTKASLALADAEAQLVKMNREARKIQLEYQKQAEKLRQIRDDESKSIDERIAANQKLGKVLTEQLNSELAIKQQALRVTDMRIEQEGESTANLDERANVLTEIADIEERIAGQESEYLTNTNSLIKEKTNLEKERLDNIRKINESINQATEDAFKRNQEAFEQSQMDFDEFVDAQFDKQDEALKQALADEESIRLDAYNKEVADFEKKESNKRAAVDLTLSTLKSTTDTFFQWQNDRRNADLESLRFNYDQQIQAARARGEDTVKLEKQFAEKEKQLKQKQDKAAKRQAVFKIALDTAGAIVAAIRQFGPPPSPLGIAGIASAALIGGAQTAAVLSAKPPQYAKGGIIGGKSHAQGGTRFVGSDGSRFEAERGEALFVLKKDATAQIAALSAINESFGGRSFSSGASHLQDGGNVQPVDIEAQVDKAMKRTPIFVRVHDIALGLSSVEKVKGVGVI